ncbi:MAG: phosphoribosylformylglycinamidine synthase subunit PurS [Ignavibacteria bacterium]
MYTARILITLRKTILDPQGKAVEHSLKSLGYGNIVDTRIGKYIELKIDVPDEFQANTITEEACKKLLANPVMEDYSFEIFKDGE